MLHLLLYVIKRQLTISSNHRSPSKLACVCWCLWASTSMADITSVNIITQWREDWSSASVVNHTIVTDSTIRQPGFDLPRHTRSLINRSRQVKAHFVLICTTWVLPNHLPVIVASDRPEGRHMDKQSRKVGNLPRSFPSQTGCEGSRWRSCDWRQSADELALSTASAAEPVPGCCSPSEQNSAVKPINWTTAQLWRRRT